ncbi:MAG: histidine--tRNA ligase [Deltaproteobacteria bacterium]|nr:MAG: histidine--tRNA ligase [Deltaproteobacteria bacterium]
MAITGIKGINDILPNAVGKWQLVESVARRVFTNFGFQEIRIPILEKTELFARSIGESTDIVEKEMYTFPDRNGQLLTLRPEATASVVRAFIQHRLHLQPSMRKFYTIGPMFRHERPQKGRYRQFHQINVEVFAIDDPMVDAEVIYLLLVFLEELNIPDITLHLNSMGCPDCRQPFRQSLTSYLDSVSAKLCSDCQRRRFTNPLRIFDCKVESCRQLVANAPVLMDHLCDDCVDNFQSVKDHLDSLGVLYTIDPHMVRGLDYYNRTTFEAITPHLGAQNAVGGGGRYDGLMKTLGGPDLPATGFAIGMERLILLLDEQTDVEAGPHRLFVACLGAKAQKRGFGLVQELRLRDLFVEMDYESRSLKAQMRRADKLGVSHVLILGEDELAEGIAVLRDMGAGTQEEIPLEGLVEQIFSRLKLSDRKLT